MKVTAERWREVDRLFAGALEKPAAERQAFLDAHCDDAELRAEVERLLAVDEQLSTFLETPAGEALGVPVPWNDEGGRVGPYRLLRRIGSGGMGTVYLARRDDEHFERLVAVKVLRSGLESTEARHRFLVERQILARLEHPNIARLYDGGSTEDGRPYLVMELVEGLPVDLYCDRHRLTLDQRLELFQRICVAVQYAHQNLLVHRDLKPANVLVTPEGEPKLLDFGIAKQLGPEEENAATVPDLRAMTPVYASPEQIQGKAVTTASDVYSLGVVLYELLAGRSPYRLAGRRGAELEAAILEAEPEPPSQALFRPGEPSPEVTPEVISEARCAHPGALARRLRGDLDQIVCRALRKDPQERYTSVAQLSQDLEDHLAFRPVSARPNSLLYRTGKFVRRHRTAMVGATLVVLLGIGLLASHVVQSRRVARERDKARYTLAFLVNTFQQADPYHSRGEMLTAREMLDEGAERATRELSGQPDVQAALLDSIGEVALGLGRYDQAGPLLEKALALRRKTFGPDSPEVAESLEHLGQLSYERSDFGNAEARLRQSLAIRRRRLGEDDLSVAKTLNLLGQVLASKGGSPTVSDDVEKLHREALAVARKAEGPAGPTVAESVLLLAQVQSDRGDYVAAEKLFRQGLAIERRALGSQHPHLFRDQASLGSILIDAGKFKEAETLLRDTLAAQRRILTPDHPDLMETLNNLAESLHRQGQNAEAEALDREVLRITRAQYGPTHWRVAAVLGNLASVIDAQERGHEAIPYLQEALEIRRKNYGEKHPMVAQALLLLAGVYRELGDYDRSLPLARQALAILEEVEGRDHPHVAYAMREIGKSYLDRSRWAEAEPYLRRSLEIRRKELAPDHPEVARAETLLAKCLIPLGHYDEADGMLRHAEATLAAQLGPEDKQVKFARTLRSELAEARAGHGRP